VFNIQHFLALVVISTFFLPWIKATSEFSYHAVTSKHFADFTGRKGDNNEAGYASKLLTLDEASGFDIATTPIPRLTSFFLLIVPLASLAACIKNQKLAYLTYPIVSGLSVFIWHQSFLSHLFNFQPAFWGFNLALLLAFGFGCSMPRKLSREEENEKTADFFKVKPSGLDAKPFGGLEVLTEIRIAKMGQAQSLNLKGKLISDPKFLEGLTKLKSLDLRENTITVDRQEILKKSLPDCKIKF
jgi:hypothetical protein